MFVVVIPVLCVIVFGIMLISIPIYKRVQERLDRVVQITRENLKGVRVIRAFCREPLETAEFERDNGALVKIQLLSGRISALMNPLTYLVINGDCLRSCTPGRTVSMRACFCREASWRLSTICRRFLWNS